MSVGRQLIQRDQGGTLSVELVSLAPVRWDASPAPTVTLLYPDGSSELVASQAATEGPSTAVATGGASAGDTDIPVDDTTGITVGRTCRVGPNALGQWEWATISAVDTTGVGDAGTISVRDELRYDYADGDPIESHRLEVDVSSTEADSVRRDCHARWTYTVGGVERHTTTLFTISIWSPTCPLTDQDVLRRNAQAANLIGSRQLLTDLIEDLWDELLGDLSTRVDPGVWVSGGTLRAALLYRVLADIPVANGDDAARDRYWQLYEAEWNKVLSVPVADVDGDGTITENDIVLPACVSRLRRG